MKQTDIGSMIDTLAKKYFKSNPEVYKIFTLSQAKKYGDAMKHTPDLNLNTYNDPKINNAAYKLTDRYFRSKQGWYK